MNETNQGLVAKMTGLGMTRQALAGVVEIRESRLCSGLKGTVELLNSEIELIDRTLKDLDDLARSIYPFSLPMDDVSRLRLLLAKHRDGELIGVIDKNYTDGLRQELARRRR
jgi:hypothetical protein